MMEKCGILMVVLIPYGVLTQLMKNMTAVQYPVSEEGSMPQKLTIQWFKYYRK